MPSAAFLAPVLCLVVDQVSAGRCRISAQEDATFLVVYLYTFMRLLSSLPTMPNPNLSRKTAFPWASSPLLDAPVPLWHCSEQSVSPR